MTAGYLGQNLHFLREEQLTIALVFFLTNSPSQPWSSPTTLATYGCRGCRGTASGAQTNTTPLGQKAGRTDVHLRPNCLDSNAPEASKVLAYSSGLLPSLNLLRERAGKQLEVGSSQCPAKLGLFGALSLLSWGTCQAFSQLGVCGHASLQHAFAPCMGEDFVIRMMTKVLILNTAIGIEGWIICSIT